MLKLYRRHKKSCGHTATSYTRCRCPIWVQGSLHGRWMRESLDLSNWEDASKKIREWESGVKPPEEMPVKGAVQKFLDDAEARHLSEATLGKLRCLLEKQLIPFCERKRISTMRQITFSDVIEFRKTWTDKAVSQTPNDHALQMEVFSTVPLLIVDDLGMRRLPATAAEDLLEIVMRR